MINLIPNEEKKKMSKDFYLRLITMFFVMLSVSLLIASILILPSYFFSSIEEDVIDTKIKSQEKSISLPDPNTLMIIKDLENKLNSVENYEKNKYVFSTKVINEIILKKIPNIKITEIFYQNDPQTGKKISISGKASSREVLLSFRRALEDDAAFSKIDLPISNFVKGSDIKFYLSLIPS
ncbi:hypothetical protein A3B84_00635 [Candidatus Nomurabacteria bacterium RIFCSPHIGHO2_02_FULL_35_13]|uniref:Uncharacterized protein n=1 Tax=Candidatus Nomurabacteria bacterium RIFCSPHIGHO2_02_FULL_35_13 TaxID=1801748 RepID=A0A1F6VP59_9BACT|nr:MAG: hypothetical protein A3B84_00635 [Candidatus Nomurabacteria bacterium RIFCSPHIGHO2_02_FULL_35_13]